MDVFYAAVFAALFYLQLNPSKVAASGNLMLAWFIFVGTFALAILMPINAINEWIGAIRTVALGAAVLFILLAIDPNAKPGVSMPKSETAPPAQPPATPPTQG